MTFDAQPPQNPAFETSVPRPVSAVLSHGWSAAFITMAADQALGYESALPWTLMGDQAPGDGSATHY